MDQAIRDQIKGILRDCVTRAIKRSSEDKTHRPFHEALLTKPFIAISSFERSFSTSFGQGPMEEISQLVAIARGDQAERQKETMVSVYRGAIDQIERIKSDLRSGTRQPDWNREVKEVLAVNKGSVEVRRVLSDLFVQRGKQEIHLSIKTVKPNLDQTQVAKEDMLLLMADNPSRLTYFGLYYNPGGESRADYNWTMPSKIFNMTQDSCVLIGKEYWDFLGGDGTYETLLALFEEVGQETRPLLGNL